MIIYIILGYLLCLVPAYFVHRVQEGRYATLQDDYRKILNEFSIRTNGRTIYKSEQKAHNPTETAQRGEFGIFLPSMAEAEEFTTDDLPAMTDDDFAHLKETGVIK